MIERRGPGRLDNCPGRLTGLPERGYDRGRGILIIVGTARQELLKIVLTLDDRQAERVLRFTRRLTAAKRPSEWPGTRLLRLAGAFEGPADLSARHDYYLAEEH